MALGTILGIAQLGMGAYQAFAGHNQQQNAYKAQKRQAQQAYNLAQIQRQQQIAAEERRVEKQRQQLKAGYLRSLDNLVADQEAITQAFGARVDQGLEQINFNNQFAADTYVLRQEKLNRAFAKQAFADQDQAVRLAQATGTQAAAGRTGVSASRFGIQNLAQQGRNNRIIAAEITGMIDDFDMQTKMNDRRSAHENYLVGQRAAILPRLGRTPQIPVMPEMRTFAAVPPMQRINKPSSAGLYMGLAQAGMSAYNTYNQFKKGKGPKLNFEKEQGFDSYLDKLTAETYAPYGGSQY